MSIRTAIVANPERVDPDDAAGVEAVTRSFRDAASERRVALACIGADHELNRCTGFRRCFDIG